MIRPYASKKIVNHNKNPSNIFYLTFNKSDQNFIQRQKCSQDFETEKTISNHLPGMNELTLTLFNHSISGDI